MMEPPAPWPRPVLLPPHPWTDMAPWPYGTSGKRRGGTGDGTAATYHGVPRLKTASQVVVKRERVMADSPSLAQLLGSTQASSNQLRRTIQQVLGGDDQWWKAYASQVYESQKSWYLRWFILNMPAAQRDLLKDWTDRSSGPANRANPNLSNPQPH